MEEENAIAGMTAAQSQNQMSEFGLSSGFGDYAGSTSLSNQMSGSITGSHITDALVPGIGTLSLINSISGRNLQSNIQRGASPHYGPGGTVQGTTSRGLFGGSVYSGNPDLDPNKSEPDNNNDNSRSSGRPGSAVKARGVSNTVSNSTRVTPNSAVRGGAPSLAPKLYARSRGKSSGIKTSSQGLLGSAPTQRKTLLGN